MIWTTQILQRQSRRILANHSIKGTCLTRRSYRTQSAVKTYLEIWREEQGDQVKPSYVRGLVEDLRLTEQFSKALEASEWMCEQRIFNVFPEDYAARLHLVETVLGLEEAEKLFDSIPENMRVLDKAEATFEKMRDLGFLSKPSPYNSMVSLYGKLQKQDVVKKLQREMMEKNIKIDEPIRNINVLRILKDIRIEMDDVQEAEMRYKEWHMEDTGPQLDMSVPGLLISRFRAEGNESKVEEIVDSIRRKRNMMHLEKLAIGLVFLGMTVGVLAVLVATMVAVVICNVWLLNQLDVDVKNNNYYSI
ncbi:PREDICTED: putative pentatricopeptide repeat-containing protein At1g43010 [Camelina sativa]|uniref:Pentatricopeptide repeat-containing protein At1g43010 n=1 Tax=Camelina sativa TaxID=90675 RepID=A0ABM0VYU5_CAMSA|nr:PREDICTED: putative pentatricopeptide repeat-containing protein At1g43010 [Camelina sativa]